MDFLDEYIKTLYIMDENLLEIDLAKISKKLASEPKMRSWFKDFKFAVDRKDGNEVVKQIQKLPVPNTPLPVIDKVAAVITDDFVSKKSLAKKVISNSLSGATNTITDLASSFLSILSSVKTDKNDNRSDSDRLKQYLKEFVLTSRKFIDEVEDDEIKINPMKYKKEDLPDLAVAWTIVAMAAGIGVGINIFIIFALPKLIFIFLILTAVVVAANLRLILGI
jgi:hypothetical protein